jgi:hypothetical protein
MLSPTGISLYLDFSPTVQLIIVGDNCGGIYAGKPAPFDIQSPPRLPSAIQSHLESLERPDFFLFFSVLIGRKVISPVCRVHWHSPCEMDGRSEKA